MALVFRPHPWNGGASCCVAGFYAFMISTLSGIFTGADSSLAVITTLTGWPAMVLLLLAIVGIFGGLRILSTAGKGDKSSDGALDLELAGFVLALCRHRLDRYLYRRVPDIGYGRMPPGSIPFETPRPRLDEAGYGLNHTHLELDVLPWRQRLVEPAKTRAQEPDPTNEGPLQKSRARHALAQRDDIGRPSRHSVVLCVGRRDSRDNHAGRGVDIYF